MCEECLYQTQLNKPKFETAPDGNLREIISMNPNIHIEFFLSRYDMVGVHFHNLLKMYENALTLSTDSEKKIYEMCEEK